MISHYEVLKISIFLLLIFVPIQIHAESPDGYLLTFEEALQLQLTEEEWLKPPPVMRGISNGPEILILKPIVNNTDSGAIIETSTPTDLLVLLKRKTSPVAMDSLVVWAKKGMFKKTLTDRLREYIDGETIDAKSLKLPYGKYLIGVEISDNYGGKTVETFRLEVSKR